MRVGKKWLERMERRAEEVATDRTREVMEITIVPSPKILNIPGVDEDFSKNQFTRDKAEREAWEASRAQLEQDDESEDDGPGLKLKVVAPSYDEAVRRIQRLSPKYEGVE